MVIMAIIAILFCTGLTIKLLQFQDKFPLRITEINQTLSRTDSDSPIENQVNLISGNFRCACGGCGEIQLIDCTCDMSRGALEEKEFMRQNLREGLSVKQIIQMVDEKYGYRNI